MCNPRIDDVAARDLAQGSFHNLQLLRGVPRRVLSLMVKFVRVYATHAQVQVSMREESAPVRHEQNMASSLLNRAWGPPTKRGSPALRLLQEKCTH